MREAGIALSLNHTKNVSNYLNESFDFVITVCHNAKEAGPTFAGAVRRRLHMGAEDPAAFQGDRQSLLEKFSEVRDGIRSVFLNFYRADLDARWPTEEWKRCWISTG